MLENMLFNCKTERQTNLTMNVHRISFFTYDINNNSHRHLVNLTWNRPENLQNILTLRFKYANTSMHTHQQRYTNIYTYLRNPVNLHYYSLQKALSVTAAYPHKHIHAHTPTKIHKSTDKYTYLRNPVNLHYYSLQKALSVTAAYPSPPPHPHLNLTTSIIYTQYCISGSLDKIYLCVKCSGVEYAMKIFSLL